MRTQDRRAALLLVPGIALMTHRLPGLWLEFPSPRWFCLKRLSEHHLPRFEIRVPSPRQCWSAAPSLSGATLLCHFSRAFPYPQPGDAGGCRSAPAGQLTATQLTTIAIHNENHVLLYIRCYPNETTMVMCCDADAMNVFLRPTMTKRNFIYRQLQKYSY